MHAKSDIETLVRSLARFSEKALLILSGRTESRDNTLVNLGAVSVVFDDLKVLVLAGLFCSSKHVEASPFQDTSTIPGNKA
ncbi:MAG: hypothetical protein ACP5SH_04725 [Syntrophobacteraceae bacterium]